MYKLGTEYMNAKEISVLTEICNKNQDVVPTRNLSNLILFTAGNSPIVITMRKPRAGQTTGNYLITVSPCFAMCALITTC